MFYLHLFFRMEIIWRMVFVNDGTLVQTQILLAMDLGRYNFGAGAQAEVAKLPFGADQVPADLPE